MAQWLAFWADSAKGQGSNPGSAVHPAVKWVPGYSWGVKAAEKGFDYPLHMPIYIKCGANSS